MKHALGFNPDKVGVTVQFIRQDLQPSLAFVIVVVKYIEHEQPGLLYTIGENALFFTIDEKNVHSPISRKTFDEAYCHYQRMQQLIMLKSKYTKVLSNLGRAEAEFTKELSEVTIRILEVTGSIVSIESALGAEHLEGEEKQLHQRLIKIKAHITKVLSDVGRLCLSPKEIIHAIDSALGAEDPVREVKKLLHSLRDRTFFNKKKPGLAVIKVQRRDGRLYGVVSAPTPSQ